MPVNNPMRHTLHRTFAFLRVCKKFHILRMIVSCSDTRFYITIYLTRYTSFTLEEKRLSQPYIGITGGPATCMPRRSVTD